MSHNETFHSLVDLLNSSFYDEIKEDQQKEEARERFLEEALELFEAMGGTADHARKMINYVYNDKPDVGVPQQEIFGVVCSLSKILNLYKIQNYADLVEEILEFMKLRISKVKSKDSTKPRFYKGDT